MDYTNVTEIVYSGRVVPAKVLVTRTGHVYRAKEYNEFVGAIKELLVEAMATWVDEYPKGKPSLFRVDAQISTMRKPRGGRVGDIENIYKPIADAGTGIIYEDDSQIASINVFIYRDQPEEGFIATFYEIIE